MGTLKKYRGMYTLEALQAKAFEDAVNKYANVPTYKDTSGNPYTKFTSGLSTTLSNGNGGSKSCRNYSLWVFETAKASSETLSQYSVDEYADDGLAVTVSSDTMTIMENSYVVKNLVLSITNDGESDASVGCIKFYKTVYPGTTPCTLLLYGYYLDSSVTVPVGETVQVSINLEFGKPEAS